MAVLNVRICHALEQKVDFLFGIKFQEMSENASLGTRVPEKENRNCLKPLKINC